MKNCRLITALLALPLVALGGIAAVAATTVTTGTVVACAHATVPAQTIADNGSPIATVPSKADDECVTTNYTVPTVTVTTGATTTVATTTTTTTPTTTTPTTTALSKPPAPTGLAVASVGDGTVMLEWDAEAASEQIDTYQVYVVGVREILDVPASQTSYTVGGLTNGTQYGFRVSAHNASGYGPWGDEVYATPSGGGTTGTTTTTTPTPTASGGAAYYGASSPWNTPIPANVSVRSESSSWISSLYNAVAGININEGSWTPVVWYADASTPRVDWTLANGWKIDNVPTPTNLAVSPEPETLTAIVDSSTGREYDLYDANPSQHTAEGGGVGRLDGSGWWNNNLGPWDGRASGAEMLGGMILASDAKAAVIDHALGCATPKAQTRGAVSPALTGDGTGPSGSMPMGSHLQLDPNLDLSSLGLDVGDAIIAKALQKYGCYVVDSTGSNLVLYAQNYHFLPGGANPYPASWGNGITKELVRHLRVVAPPPTPVYDDRTVFGEPHQ